MDQMTIFDVLDEAPVHAIKNPDAKYLTADHFDDSQTNPNFVSYLLANGKRVGDEYRLYEAQIWINQQVVKFKKSHGRKEQDRLAEIPEWPDKLKAFLREGHSSGHAAKA